MSDLKELIAEVASAEANGMRFTCVFGGDTRRESQQPIATTTAKARWNSAVDAELAQCRGSRAKATAQAAKKRPELRAALLAEANPGRTPTARTTAKQTPQAKFNDEMQTLIDAGMSKLEAAKLLSRRMGLSSEQGPKPFVSSRNDY